MPLALSGKALAAGEAKPHFSAKKTAASRRLASVDDPSPGSGHARFDARTTGTFRLLPYLVLELLQALLARPAIATFKVAAQKIETLGRSIDNVSLRRMHRLLPWSLIFDLPGSVHVSAINLFAMVDLRRSRRPTILGPVQSRLSRDH
jgi:hypothetical protein